VGSVFARGEVLGALLGLFAWGCGTVDPGQDVQFAEIAYDQGYFYCKVEPMLFQQECGPGKQGTDASGGCHYNVTTFRLTKHDPIPCNKGLVPAARIPPEAESNYQAAAREMTPDPERAPLLNRPTKQAAHPREIFDSKSEAATVIREWATKYTSQ
jgi:hypothetical protein